MVQSTSAALRIWLFRVEVAAAATAAITLTTSFHNSALGFTMKSYGTTGGTGRLAVGSVSNIEN